MGLFSGSSQGREFFSDLRKYVGDFELTEEENSRGRKVKKARYIGTWTVLREFSPGVKLRLRSIPVLTVLLAGIYFRMLTLTHLFSGNLLVMIPLLAGLFPAMYLAMGAFSLPFRGKPMRRDQYMHSFIRIFRSATATGAFILAGQLAALISRAVHGDWMYLSADWKFTGYGIAALAAAAGSMTLLRGIETTERPNSYYTP